jgi:hypothetical protein
MYFFGAWRLNYLSLQTVAGLAVVTHIAGRSMAVTLRVRRRAAAVVEFDLSFIR